MPKYLEMRPKEEIEQALRELEIKNWMSSVVMYVDTDMAPEEIETDEELTKNTERLETLKLTMGDKIEQWLEEIKGKTDFQKGILYGRLDALCWAFAGMEWNRVDPDPEAIFGEPDKGAGLN